MIFVKGIPVPLVRSNQLFLVIGLGLAIVLRQPWIVGLELATAIVALWGGPRWHPVFAVMRPLLGERLAHAEREDARMQRFNQTLAVGMLTLAILAFVSGFPLFGYILSGFLAAVALAGALGFCLGCYLYRFIAPWMRAQA